MVFILELLFLLEFVLIIVCNLLINRIIWLLEWVIFCKIDLRCFLNFFLNLVFVMRLFILRLISWCFLRDFGILLLIICWVKFFVIVVFFIFGFLISIGLFFVWWDR